MKIDIWSVVLWTKNVWGSFVLRDFKFCLEVTSDLVRKWRRFARGEFDEHSLDTYGLEESPDNSTSSSRCLCLQCSSYRYGLFACSTGQHQSTINSDPSDKPAGHWSTFFQETNETVEVFDSYEKTWLAMNWWCWQRIKRLHIMFNSFSLKFPLSVANTVCSSFRGEQTDNRTRK